MIDLELIHGHTVASLHTAARLAVHTARGGADTSWHERYEIAWMACAETLYTAAEPPARYQLVSAGQIAILQAVDAEQRSAGYYRRKTDGAAHGPGSSPKYRVYWWDVLDRLTAPSPEEPIVDRAALAQIWPRLSERERIALGTLAAHNNNYPAAADALGWSGSKFRTAVMDARRVFLRLWHEGEQPSHPWRPAGRRREAA